MSKTDVNTQTSSFGKVPAVTFGFWVIKILATTLGETGGDTASMTLGLGYLSATFGFLILFVALASAQIKSRRFLPWLYWGTIIASTMVGTTLADFATRSVGIGYPGGSLVLAAMVIASLTVWRFVMGSVSVDHVHEPRAETFYWITITASQTLGTALGDWTADTAGLGYGGAALVFSALLAFLVGLHLFTNANKVVLFWVAFILTRPLGAAVGDLLDKPIAQGGFDFSRPMASIVLGVAILMLIAVLPQRAIQAREQPKEL